MSRRRALLATFLCALLGLIGERLADSYIPRLPNHAGYYLVAVPDQIQPQHLLPGLRPRHAVVVVIDGLRADHALAMQSVQRLRAAGQCLPTWVGALSVSRPVYAVLSTGLEQDRTGARNNDQTLPLHAESIWQVARRSGRRVTATSELPWFQELFPDGFDSYQLVARPADHFTTAEAALGDLTLIHPVYVDENGHQYGGSSPQYAAAAVRADHELGRLLDRLDLTRDLVVFTADHGHTDRGGHGADSLQVGQVLTCFAGHGVRRLLPPAGDSPPAARFDSRAIAPTLAVLLQLRFPQNLRAGQDSLDTIWGLVDPGVYPAAYLDDRHAAVQRFRQANGAAVGRWLGRSGPGEWSDLYAQAQRWQLGRGLLFLGAVFFLCFFTCRQFWPRRPVRFVLWVFATLALLVLAYTVARGSFDFNSMNSRPQFLKWASAASVFAAVGSMGLYLGLTRDRVALAIAQLQLALLLLAVSVAHIAAFGWPLGFPLPGRVLIFLPFIGNAFLAWQAALAGVVWLTLVVWPRPAAPAAPAAASPPR